MSTPFTWNYHLPRAEQQLVEAGVEDARTNVEYIFARTLGLKHRREIPAVVNQRAWREEKRIFYRLLRRRIDREPLQYILGEWEFYGMPFFLNEHVLIPRPETEILVEEALKESVFLKRKIGILDLGTGCGCIALAIASQLPKASVFGIDISIEATKVAKKNAARLRIANARFRCRNLFRNKGITMNGGRFEMIVSNPPYISKKEFETLEPELRLFEPRVALTDEKDGLRFYRRIAKLAPKLLKKNGKVLVEIGFGTADAVTAIFESSGLEVLRIVKDLAGIERVVVAEARATSLQT